MNSSVLPFRLASLLRGFLLVWFMVITSFGVVHNAEHGFHKHDHYGHECPVYDFCEHQNLGDGLGPVALFIAPFVPFVAVFDVVASLVDISPVVAAPARAPPFPS